MRGDSGRPNPKILSIPICRPTAFAMNEKPFSSDLNAPAASPPPIAPPFATPPISPAPAPLAAGEAAPDASNEALQSALHIRSSGANWFYWIAGLSIVNSVIVLFGGDTSFPLGLGITLGIDVVARELSGAARAIGPVFDFLVIGFFVLCGLKAGKGANWAFIVGGLFYALDTLLMLAIREWIGVGLHLWALFSLFSGYKANKAVRELQKTATASPWSG